MTSNNSLNFVYIELKTNENVVVKVTKDLLNEYESKLLLVAAKIESMGENNLPSYKNCKCEYSKICF